MNRRKFISLSCISGLAYTAGRILPATGGTPATGYIMTVNGKLNPAGLGTFLPHEHVITDFTGAEKIVQPQYNAGVAFNKMLPHLQAAKKNGVNVLAECTPAYIGRDVRLLQQLSKGSDLHIITNTGYYAASGAKYLPRHAYTETSTQLAKRWINEWEHGIDGTGIKPGFIKLGVDGGPLGEVQQKLVQAAAYTHLQSGLKIAIHNGGATAVYQQLEILEKTGVGANALIWVHAQNDPDGQARIALAKKGCWISLDGVNATDAAIKKYSGWIKTFKEEGLLHRLLLSHDDGFAVDKKDAEILFEPYKNGNTTPYTSLFTVLKPALLKEGITEADFNTITTKNPAQAFTVEVCRVG